MKNTINTIKSEVEINANLISVNDKLFYTDAANCQKWIVTELFEGGFEAKCEGKTKDFYFNELQFGWSVSDKTKSKHEINDRYEYKNAA